MDVTILGLSFLEGMGLILSPCILPILPLILATGIQGGKLRPYGIIFGFIITFTLFTIFVHRLASTLHIGPQVFQNISIYLILAFGIILFSDYLSDKFSLFFQKFANFGQTLSTKTEENIPDGFWSGILLGIGIALIWTPCVGPILAIVLVQTLQQKADYHAALILTAFSIGIALPMLIITIFSKMVIQKVRGLSKHTRLIRKILASIIILTILFTEFNLWQKLFALQATPVLQEKSLPTFQLLEGLKDPYPAPQIGGVQKWINSEPLNLELLKKQGKVVLVTFWAYSCINCIRTLPYLNDLYEKYHDKGLVIIGIHSPEFEFEKDEQNVEKAVKEDKIKYPVALDNDLVTWGKFNNRFWPARYLINKEGKIVYTHFGEGKYDITESNIRYLLGLSK